jgi:hypothetical protein
VRSGVGVWDDWPRSGESVDDEMVVNDRGVERVRSSEGVWEEWVWNWGLD